MHAKTREKYALWRVYGYRKPDAIEGYDPESEADRSALLESVGMKEALFVALNTMMAGGRLKNSQTPPGR